MNAVRQLREACDAWSNYFTELDRLSDDDDPMAAARTRFHSERLAKTRDAIAAHDADTAADKPLADCVRGFCVEVITECITAMADAAIVSDQYEATCVNALGAVKKLSQAYKELRMKHGD